MEPMQRFDPQVAVDQHEPIGVVDHHHRHLLPDLGDRADQSSALLAVVDPQIAMSELELVQVHFHAVTLPSLASDLHLVLRHHPHQLRRISPQDPALASAFRLARALRGLWLLPQRSQLLLASSRLARRPMALPAAAAADPAAPADRPISPRPPPSANAARDRSRDAGHATPDPLRGAARAGTLPCRTLAAGLLRVRQAGTIVGISNTDASCAQHPRPSPTTEPSPPRCGLSSGSELANHARGRASQWVTSRKQTWVTSDERRRNTWRTCSAPRRRQPARP